MERTEIAEKSESSAARNAQSERDAVIAKGRGALDAAASQKAADPRNAKILEAVAHFQAAIALDPAADDAMGWLSKALRTLSQSVRPGNPDAADYLIRCACAVAWEAKTTAPPASISGLSRQEAKTLLAWVRTTRHLSPAAGEAAMEEFRAHNLPDALDLDQIRRQAG